MITLNQVQLKSVCAKFHADWTKSQGGVRKSMFCICGDLASKMCSRSGRLLYVRKPSCIQGTYGYKVCKCIIQNVEVTSKNGIASIIALPSGVQVQFLVWKNCVLFYLYHINFKAVSIIVWLKLMFVVYLVISHAHIDQS